MTGRSFGSQRSRLSKRERVTDQDVYDYSLRVAYLRHLTTPRTSAASEATKKEEPKESRYRISGISSSIYSIGDLFKDMGRDGTKSPKFPKELLSVLQTKLQNIAMNKDPEYTEQLIRGTVAIFWGSFQDPAFYRQMKENRKIEDLILMFVSTATNSLKKNKQLQGDAWKLELNNQIAQFIRILRESLRLVSHVPPELTGNLEKLAARLVPNDSHSDSGYGSMGSTTSTSGPSMPSVVFGSVPEMPLVQTVGRLFAHSDHEMQADLSALGKICTLKAALADLKACLKHISTDGPYPGRRSDFDSDEAWQHWRSQEVAQLSQLISDMVQIAPELAKSTPSEAPGATSPRPTSIYSIREISDDPTVSRRASAASRYSLNVPSFPSDIDSTNEESPSNEFTYIPPNPKKYYKRLVELCTEADLRAMSSLEGDEEVSLGILSSSNLDLINECATRWRIGSPFRVTCFLDIIKYKYEREEVPLECIPDAMQLVAKTAEDLPMEDWPTNDGELLTQVYGALFNIFLGSLYHALEFIESLEYVTIAPAVGVLERIQESGLMERYDVDVSARIDDLAGRVRDIAAQQYSLKSQELFAAQVGVNRALPLLLLTDWVEKQAKTLDKRFGEPLLGTLDLVSVTVEIHVPLFLSDLDQARRKLLEGSMNQPTPDVPIEDIFALYRRTQTMLGLLQAFAPHIQEDFDVIAYFKPYVLQWLVNTDNRTGQWVNTAISVDQFEAVGEEGHSSSIVDLFDFIKPPIDFVLDLEWVDKYEEAQFLTSLAKTISKSIEHYCRTMEELFMTEMYPRATPETVSNKPTLIERARLLTITGERPVEPFNFTESSCVKLNNIEAARKLLDQLYARIDADKVAQTLEELTPPVPDKVEHNERYLFTVKVISAENLSADSVSKLDTFVTLSDEKGVRLAKTRTIYETGTPRWEETFDFSVQNTLWLMASVRDRALIGKHDTIGRAYLCLDPARFGDFLAHDLGLDLDPQGRIFIRVSMEGEKDDILFYFGRAFRSLKRAENDMTRIFIDKMKPIIHQSLSRNVLKAFVKSGLPSLDYTKVLGGARELYKSAMGGSTHEVQIPLPAQEKPKIRPEQLTDTEIEQAITPLFDYFEQNLQVLNIALSASTREIVMMKVWKEILSVIEGLLLPPLSEAPTDMKPLSDKEVDIVFKWLKVLRDFFYAGGEGPVPLELLQNQKYRDIVSVRLYYDWHTDALMEECVQMMQQSLKAAPTVKRAKSVYQQRNLGTIKDRKKEKRKEAENSNGDIILRILRMRPRTTDFIAQQMRIQAAMQNEQEARLKRRAHNHASGGTGHLSRLSRSPIPPEPPSR